MFIPAVMLFLGVIFSTATPVTKPTQTLSPKEYATFNLLASDLRHYARTSPIAAASLDFYVKYAVLATADVATKKFHSVTQPKSDTFFVVVIQPSELVTPNIIANFSDSTRTMFIDWVPSWPLIRAASMVHELCHARENLFGLAATLSNNSSFALAEDEYRAYQHEGAFLNEVTNGAWQKFIQRGIAIRDSIYGPLNHDRFREYTGSSDEEMQRLCHLLDCDFSEVKEYVLPVFELNLGYTNIDRQYLGEPDVAFIRKINLTKAQLLRYRHP